MRIAPETVIAAAVIERVRDVVTVVDDDPERVRARDQRETLGVPKAAREQPAVRPVGIVDVNRCPHRGTLRVGRANVAGRCNRDVQLVVAVEGDVLELVPVRAIDSGELASGNPETTTCRVPGVSAPAV
jgi:hypothetical protein